MRDPHPTETTDRTGYPWRSLDLACGGLDPVDELHDDPLPDEPFDRSAVPPALIGRVHDVLLALGGFCDRNLDDEYRTAMRRLLARAARRGPDWFAGRQPADRLAAAVAWVTMSGNFALSRRHHTWSGEDIWHCFGVGRAADLGRNLARQLGMIGADDDYATFSYAEDMGTDIILADVALLHSQARRHLLGRRAQAVQLDEHMAARREATKPVRHVGDGRFEVRSRSAAVIGASKGISTEGRAHVVLAFGDDLDTAEMVAVTIPDAHTLVESIHRALDSPMLVT